MKTTSQKQGFIIMLIICIGLIVISEFALTLIEMI